MACEQCGNGGKDYYEYENATNVAYRREAADPVCLVGNILANQGCASVAAFNNSNGCNDMCPGCDYFTTDAGGIVSCFSDVGCGTPCSGVNELTNPVKKYDKDNSGFAVSFSWILGALLVLAVLYRHRRRSQ